MERSWLKKVLLLPAAIAFLLTGASLAKAQSVTFSGRVTSSDGQPLAGASVGITDLEVGAVTNEQGQYTFTARAARATGRTLIVVARHIGYKPARYTARISTDAVQHDFSLERDVLHLNEVVVTGTSAATETSKTPFAVNVVDAQQIKEVPSSSPLGALAGKVPGAVVITANGQPGSEPAIRLRSATSLTGRQDPLIIVDGTITNLSMADINSEDIDRVEIIKGAAASSLYGSNAANGVIQIFTKRGANLGEGQTAWTARTEYGASVLPNIPAGNLHHNYKLLDPSNPSKGFDASGGGRSAKDDLIADAAYPVYYNQYREVYRPGQAMTNYISIGQRQGRTNYNASFENTHDQGVLRLLDGYRRQNFRVNVDQAITDKFDMGAGAFYGRSTSKQSDNNFGLFFGMRFLEPNVNIDSLVSACPAGTTCSFLGQYNPVVRQPPLSGNVDNPLYDLQVLQKDNNRDRFTGTFRTAYRPLDWITAEGNVGYDEENQAFKSLVPFGYTSSSGNEGSGSLTTSNDNNREYNVGVGVTGVRQFGFIHNTTKLAASYEDQTNSNVNVVASKLTVPHVPEFGSADPSASIRPGSTDQVIRAKNVFAISTFDIKDRYILDGLVRRDQSSLFGADERSAVYQRISGAWRVTQDMHIPGVEELKLHVSDGTAGLRPNFDAQYETFSISSGHPVKVTLGNTKLRPAFSRETEYGATLNLRRNYSLEYTYSRKRTTDEIIQVPLSAASGYQSQWQNAGTLSGHTHELALGAVLASARDYFWRVSITGDRTRQKIDALSVPPFLVGPDGTTNMFRIAPNQPFGIIYGEKWVRTAEQLQQTIDAGKLTGTVADYVVNEEGLYVKKTQYHTVAEVPLRAYVCEQSSTGTCSSVTSNQIIGDVNPDFNMGLNSTLQFKGLSITGTLTWVKGGNIYNMTRQWPFNELRDPVFDQSSKPATTCAADWPTSNPTCPYATGKKPTSYYSTFYDGITPNDYFVENGTYLRLRELAVNYSVPQRLLSAVRMSGFHTMRIGLVGRNLWTHTKYSGYDPDVTGPAGDPFAYRVDYFTYPGYRTVTGMIELGF
jgi:TonB-linked SusC/RagA family outer membrane protein